MTSDSQSKQPPEPAMALLQSHPILLAVEGGDNASRSHLSAAIQILKPPPDDGVANRAKPYDERARLLDPTRSRTSPTSSASTSPSPSDKGQVYPWSNYRSTGSSTTTRESVATSDAASARTARSDDATAHHTTGEQKQTATFTKLLARAQSMTSTTRATAANAFSVVTGHGYPHKEQRRHRYSILRVSSNKSPIDKPLRKSASVEFAIHSAEPHRLATQDRRDSNNSNTTPRRLTYEEKEELYKIRPDLEVGPSPFYKEQLRELEQRNQRRMLFAIVGGVMCLMFLMVIYYILSIA